MTNSHYEVTVTYKDVSCTKTLGLTVDPETWRRTPPGRDGVSRFIPNGSEGDELAYVLGKYALEALRECMVKVHKAFF